MTMSTAPGVVAPLFASSALLPMGEPGGVAYPMQHAPGVLRPFGASLAVPMRQAGRHSTDSTSPATSQRTGNAALGQKLADAIGVSLVVGCAVSGPHTEPGSP
jgi:hypothetical protein